MNHRKQYIRWLAWLPTIIMMIIIFAFSAKPAVVSEGTSSPIAEAFVGVFEAVFGKIAPAKRVDWVSTMNFIVRKAAHITEYMILAICISFPLWVNQIQERKRVLIALLASIIYAGTDEFHQTFIAGRSGSIRDVGIDSIGVVLGCFIFFLFIRSINRRKKKKQA